ncbi:filamentous hemagglutinin N-terminal domain-containing protein, partial [Exilibacterium tricleocarpae]
MARSDRYSTPSPQETTAAQRRSFSLDTLLAAVVLAGQAALVQAGPTGGEVVGGSGVINYGDKLTQIHQHSSRLAVDWQSFNIDVDEKVQFLQPGSSAIALNRILSQDASTIRGSIVANGHVLLVNTRGVLFTETSTVNAGGLVVSGLDLSPDDFLAGNYEFSAVEGEAGFVVNRGLISAASGIGLLGTSVANEATGSLISAGLVSLNAGSEAVLTFDADNMIGIRVTREVLSNDLGVDDAVLNAGDIQAGNVLLDAQVSSDLFSSAVNNTGVVQATGIDTSGGKIRLTGLGGDVASSGELKVSAATDDKGGDIRVEGDRTIISGSVTADSAEGIGGRIQLLGDKVGLLDNAFVSASGAFGGGEVLIGGDYLGGNAEVRNAQVSFLGADAQVWARATENGDGGRVILWADDTTRFYGSIDASAGLWGGDGGFVETSGKHYVDLSGSVTAAATAGAHGLWLIDPADITIGATTDQTSSTSDPVVWTPNNGVSAASISAAEIVASLNGGTSVEVKTENDTVSQNGNITVKADIVKSAGSDATLTLNADRAIGVDAGVQISSSVGRLGLAFNAGDSITIAGDLTTNGGDAVFTTTAGNIDIAATGSVATGGGAIDFSAGGTGAGTGSIGIAGTITTFNSAGTLGGSVTLKADNDVAIGAAVDTRGSTTDGNVLSTSVNFSNSAAIESGAGSIGINIGTRAIAIGDLSGRATIGAALNSGANTLSGATAADVLDINSGGVVLSTTDGNFTAAGDIAVTGVESVEDTGDLTGSTDAENFDWDGTRVLVEGISFTGVGNLSGGTSVGDMLALSGAAGSVGVNLGTTAGAFLVLTPSPLQVVGEIDSVSNTGDLTANSAGDSFDWNGTRVQVDGVDFTGVDNLSGNSGTDSLALSGAAAAAGVNLGPVAGAFTVLSASNLAVAGAIDSVSNTGDLTANSAGDSFDWNGTRVQVDGVDFTDVGNLSGNSGTDSLTLSGAAAAAGVDLGAGVGAFTVLSASNLAVAGAIDSVSNTGDLTANSAGDSFDWNGTRVQVDGVDFTDVGNLSGNSGTDSLTLSGAAAAAGVDLGAGVGAFTVLSASNLQVAGAIDSVSNTGDLTANSAGDSFDWNGTRVQVDGVDFTDVGNLSGNSGTDSLALSGAAAAAGVDLGPVAGAFTVLSASNLQVAGAIDSVSNTGDLTGSASVENFIWDGTAISLGSTVSFGGVDSLVGGTGDTLDNLDNGLTLAAGSQYVLGGSAISVSGIQTVNN